MSKNERIYFDSCIYLAFYRKEVSSYGKARMDAVFQTWFDNSSGNGPTIVTSSIAIAEVVPRLKESALDAEIEDFKNKFKFGKHELHDPDPKISERAADYRVYYKSNPVSPPTPDAAGKRDPVSNLTTCDAIHLATAVLYKCDEFWTFDGLNPKPDKHRSVKPLWLNNAVGKDRIIITPPSVSEGILIAVPPSKKPLS